MGKNEVFYPSLQKFIKVKWTSGSDDMHYSVFCDDLPEDVIQNAMREVNETEENRAQGIRNLRKFMEKKGLTCSDDQLLIFVLRNCKYDIKKSESKLEKFLKLRQMMINKLARDGIKDIEAGMDLLGIGIFPYRDTHGRIMLFTRPIEELSTYETDSIVFHMLAMIMFTLSLPMTSLFGITHIGGADCSSMHICYSLMNVFRHLLPNMANIPIRIRKVALVNEHFLFRWFYIALRPILPRKIANRVTFLGEGYENLCKHFHPDILPNEYGGNLGPLNDTFYRKKFLDFLQTLKAEHSSI